MGGFEYSGVQWTDYILMVQGAWRTIQMMVAAAALATVLGFILGCLKLANIFLIRAAVDTLTDLVRSVPLLVKVTLLYSGLNILGFSVGVFVSGTLALALSSGCYISEIVRDAFLSVPVTLRKAARGLGMTTAQEFRYVVIPLGIRQAFPSWLGIVLGIVKDTSVVAVIGYVELLKATQIIIIRTQEPMPLLATAAAFYFCICFPLSLLGRGLERYFTRGELT